jgi:hypothetical protein
VVFLSFDLSDAELLDDFLNAELEKAFIRENLLRDETILLKVAVNHLPGVLLVDGIHGAHLFEVTH